MIRQYFVFGKKFCFKKEKSCENSSLKKTQIEKDFRLLKYNGLFYEYLEMGM